MDEDTLNPEFNETDTNCRLCNLISHGIYLKINIIDSGFLKDFVNRNSYVFPDSFLLVYNTNLDSWQANYTLSGRSNIDNVNETWNFVFEFSCLTEFAQMDYDGKALKFSTLIRKITNNVNTDTKVTIFLPSADICADAKDGFILDLIYYTQDNYVDSNFDLIIDFYLIHDGIGLFKDYIWLNNPVLFINLKDNSGFEEYPKFDISPIFPK
jgi:hypothetical protein